MDRFRNNRPRYAKTPFRYAVFDFESVQVNVPTLPPFHRIASLSYKDRKDLLEAFSHEGMYSPLPDPISNPKTRLHDDLGENDHWIPYQNIEGFDDTIQIRSFRRNAIPVFIDERITIMSLIDGSFDRDHVPIYVGSISALSYIPDRN